jgi:hypothetical protein
MGARARRFNVVCSGWEERSEFWSGILFIEVKSGALKAPNGRTKRMGMLDASGENVV